MHMNAKYERFKLKFIVQNQQSFKMNAIESQIDCNLAHTQTHTRTQSERAGNIDYSKHPQFQALINNSAI